MPKHAQLALKLFAVQKCSISIVDTKELMVLCDDFGAASVIENKVLDVIQQGFLLAKSLNIIFQTDAVFLDGLSVWVFFFIMHFQPLEEELIPGTEAAEARLHSVGKHTDLVVVKEIRDVLQIIFQINVIGVLHRNIAVF